MALFDLVAEVRLEAENVALPFCERLMVADVNLLGHLLNEAKVVRHKNYAAVERVDRLGQRVYTLHIEMILQQTQMRAAFDRNNTNRRLIKQQQMRLLPSEPRKRDATTLPVGKLLDGAN